MQHVPLWSTDLHFYSFLKRGNTSNVTRDCVIGIVTTLQAELSGVSIPAGVTY